VYQKTRTLNVEGTSTLSPTISRRAIASIAGIASFVGLTILGANIIIPLTPVPVTLQTLFVLLAGAVIGSRRGALSQFLYVGAGAVGLPFFAGFAGGWTILGGPTGGYLLSFLFVPFLVGRLLPRSTSIRWQVFVFSAATLVIFAFGLAYLALFYTHSLSAAVTVGLVPFIPGAVFKIAAATSIYRSFRALADRRNL
jgi:biotin transport system substrate-specific component